MPDQKTHVGIVIDTSTSMSNIWNEAFDGLKQVITDLQGKGDEAGAFFLTVVPFSGSVPEVLPAEKTPIDDLDVEEVFGGLEPRGWTALNDGIGRLLEVLMKDDDGETAFLVYIMTDGEENSSQKFTTEEIKAQIAKLSEKGCWTISFVGCNQIAENTAGAYAIQGDNALSFASDAQGTRRAMVALRGVTQHYVAGREAGEMMATGALFSAEVKSFVADDDEEEKTFWETAKNDSD